MSKEQTFAFILSSLFYYVWAGLLSKEEALKIAKEYREKIKAL